MSRHRSHLLSAPPTLPISPALTRLCLLERDRRPRLPCCPPAAELSDWPQSRRPLSFGLLERKPRPIASVRCEGSRVATALNVAETLIFQQRQITFLVNFFFFFLSDFEFQLRNGGSALGFNSRFRIIIHHPVICPPLLAQCSA